MTEQKTFADRLLSWWDEHGRHDLPWQYPRTPYRVWISEIMLQQTQVATVIPYFERWMVRFPDLTTLADANVDEVLALWSGLGYYARARNLHKAAQFCMEHHGGALPGDPEALHSLPGIGASTANAIISQAHDRPLPILDGNAKRVLARHAAIDGWPGQAKVLKQFWAEANERLPASRGAVHTQAIMDLGATVCTRGQPDCAACPVSADCQALLTGTVERYPAARPRIQVKEQTWYLLILRRTDGAILLERRPAAGIWGGLWCLPQAEGTDELTERFGIDPGLLFARPQFEHRLTHRRLRLHPVEISAPVASGVECSDEADWFASSQWPGLGLPKPVRAILEQLENGIPK